MSPPFHIIQLFASQNFFYAGNVRDGTRKGQGEEKLLPKKRIKAALRR